MSKPHRCNSCRHPGGVNRQVSNGASKKSCSCQCHAHKAEVKTDPAVQAAAESLADAASLPIEKATELIEHAVKAYGGKSKKKK